MKNQNIPDLTQTQIIETLQAEIAKGRKEVRCARSDLEQAHNRLSFSLTMLNRLKDKIS